MDTMIVFTKRNQSLFAPGSSSGCSVCGEDLYAPFLVWDVHGRPDRENIHICMPCAHKIKTGLCADLIRLSAMHELQMLMGKGWGLQWSLKTTSLQALQTAEDKDIEQEKKITEQMGIKTV